MLNFLLQNLSFPPGGRRSLLHKFYPFGSRHGRWVGFFGLVGVVVVAFGLLVGRGDMATTTAATTAVVAGTVVGFVVSIIRLSVGGDGDGQVDDGAD